MAFDPFNSLAPTSRRPAGASQGVSGGAGRARLRIGVGAAVVLLLAVLGVTVAVTAIGQVGHSVEVPAGTGSVADPDEGSGAVGESSGESSDAPPTDRSGAPGSTGAPAVFVHVLGAVVRPGLFEVHQGARVVDVVAAAGGLLPTADEAGLNLARLVTDGEQLYVPVQGEVPPGAPTGANGTNGAAPVAGAVESTVNLNTATLADLDTLPRIGPAMAQRILDYRDAHGRFASVDDLRNVTGIGDKTFAALEDLITV